MKNFTIFIFLIWTSFLFAQTQLEPGNKVHEVFDIYKENVLTQKNLVWGASIGGIIDFSGKRNASLRLWISGSIARSIYQKQDFYVLGNIQTEIEFFRGGLGTSSFNEERSKFSIELRNYLQLIAGGDFGQRMDGRPMNISLGQSMSTLYDPLDVSINLGTCFINGLNHKRNQHLGFGAIGARYVQLYYANDGPPWGNIFLGDKFDRLWTGSGQLGIYFLNDSGLITDLALRYDKYTGYQPHIYELGYTIQIDNLPYKEKDKQYFNQSRWQVRVGIRNMTHVNLSIYNPLRRDVQNAIHYERSMPYHTTPLGRFYTFGLDYQYRFIKIEN